jgi:GAF domain-containing protein
MAADGSPGLEKGREALRRFLVGEDDLTSMLTKITLIATEQVEGCDYASITMMKDGTPRTPVFTDKLALVLDETQYKAGDGPCLSAIRQRGIEHVTTATDPRWPEFMSAARQRDVTATLSLPMVDSGTETLGGLNLYSKSVTVFDDETRESAALYADQLGVAAAKVAVYAGSLELAQQLRMAMESRAVIEQAEGILIAAQKCSPEVAFDILRRASQIRNRKLRDIAADLVHRYTGDGSTDV